MTEKENREIMNNIMGTMIAETLSTIHIIGKLPITNKKNYEN